MTRSTIGKVLLAAGLVASASAAAQLQPQSAPQSGPQSQPQPQPRAQAARGELLYSTHCIACHTTQMHWRAKKLVVDWTSLEAEVRRWAGNARLGWSDEEIVDVARYLNTTIYRFPAAKGIELGTRDAVPRT
jgi:mono/diheme cytochrome c family protein